MDIYFEPINAVYPTSFTTASGAPIYVSNGSPISVSPAASGYAEQLYAAWEELDNESEEYRSYRDDESSIESPPPLITLPADRLEAIRDHQDEFGRANRVADDIYDFAYNNSIFDDSIFNDQFELISPLSEE